VLAPGDLDATCKACDDFYRFATGGWIKKNPIPAGHATWGSLNQLSDENRAVITSILEDAAKNTSAAPGSDEQKIGAFYRACMNEARHREGRHRADRSDARRCRARRVGPRARR
jgi:putative endopeptidase